MKIRKMTDKKDQPVVAAIDFGIAFSGYAFSFKHDYERDPLSTSIRFNGIVGCGGHFTLKVPTCVLLNPHQEFVAFGYEAEDIYSDLALNENHYDYYFFEGFKMLLYEANVSTKVKKKEILY